MGLQASMVMQFIPMVIYYPPPPPGTILNIRREIPEYFAAKHKILLHVMATMVNEAHSSALKKKFGRPRNNFADQHWISV